MFPATVADDNSFYGVHSPFRVANVVKESATSSTSGWTEVGVAKRASAKEENFDRENCYAIRALKMVVVREANHRHGRPNGSRTYPDALSFLSRISVPEYTRTLLARAQVGKEVPGTPRGNVKYAKSRPVHRKIVNTEAKSGTDGTRRVYTSTRA